MGYLILDSDDTLRLTAEVIQRMTKGWWPLGCISCYYNSRSESPKYVQAMVHEPADQTETGRSQDRISK